MSFEFSLDKFTKPIKQEAFSPADKGEEALTAGNFRDAEKHFFEALEIEKTEQNYYNLALAYYLQDKTDLALKTFQKCLEINTYNESALEYVGDIFIQKNLGRQAIENYCLAITANENVPRYKEKLMNIIRTQTFKKIGDPLKNIILLCLKDNEVNIESNTASWLSISLTNEALKDIYKFSKYEDYPSFKKAISQKSNLNALNDEFFIAGLKRLFFPDLTFEAFLKNIRHYLLETLDEWTGNDHILNFVVNLGLYAHFTDFVFTISEDEAKILEKLEKKKEFNEYELGIYGCYKNLGMLGKDKNIEEQFGKHPILSELFDRHIGQAQELHKHALKIEKLTDIDDDVSSKVQDMYEESPYPRWSGFSKQLKDQEKELWGNNARILVAGCGTGQEAIELAYQLPDSDILAVDLSRSSIAYAKMKCAQHGISNITFKHADILKLGGALEKESFDYVASSGVLHHMHDPLAGWKIITSLLKPNGLMRIALYSKLARQSVTHAREIIKEHNFPQTPTGVRAFREEAKELLEREHYKTLTSFRDYYTTPECRDLIFHVQEHQYTVPMIKEQTEELELDFLGFYLPPNILDRYHKRYKDDPAGTRFEYWSDYEEKYPETFLEMYKFWCRKKA